MDLIQYIIDVSVGDKIPRKGGSGITKSDRLIINKMDIVEQVHASLDVRERDSKKMRGERPCVFTNLYEGQGWTRSSPSFWSAECCRSDGLRSLAKRLNETGFRELNKLWRDNHETDQPTDSD